MSDDEGMTDLLYVNGGTPLSGEITVRGAKNFVSKAMVASLLGDGPSLLRNVPRIRDVEVVTGLLKLHGVDVQADDQAGTLNLDPSNVESAHVADIDAHAGSSRIPILFCGPLLHRLGEAFIPDLGGCRIGDRPINYHLDILRKFGAVVEKREQGIHITAPRGLEGTKIALPYPSVGATEQLLLTAVRADGITELSNAAIEPEIMDLINVLQKMGAIISVDTDRVMRIEGVEQLHGFQHTALSDRIEAASWASAALATRGDIYVRGARQPEMTAFLNTFRRVGGEFDVDDEGIRFYHPGGDLNPIVLETDVHPGFMTDWQQSSSSRSRRPRACRSCTRPSTRTGSGSPTRSSAWVPRSRSTRSASGGGRAASGSATSTTRPSSRARRRSRPPRSRSLTCGAASATSSRRSPRRAPPRSRASG